MNLNPWHSVSFGEKAPEIVNGIIEIPKGSRAKYELDKESGLLKLDRVLYSSVYYPANYGFIPQTYCDDKDPLDILILSQIQIVPLCIVPARVIGVMRMIDGGEADDKIIAVAADDISVSHIDDISKLPAMFMEEIRHFFEEYKRLENKTVCVEEFQDARTAHRIILKAVEDYNDMTAKVMPSRNKVEYNVQAA
jgi:inorganic pyrophosphatase